MEKGYKKLLVWQKANELAKQVYMITKEFPKEEIYGITSQLRRAVLSIPANIVEGTGRQGKKELKHFTNIALGSLFETEYLLDFCRGMGYLNNDKCSGIEMLRAHVGALLWKFYHSL